MKNALYIGSNEHGSTSSMRYEALKSVLVGTHKISIINTSSAFDAHARIINSIGCRFKFGPLIQTLSKKIKENIRYNEYDFIWVDKAALIHSDIVLELRKSTPCLLHYTPDPAFFYHQSRFFRKTVSLYDYCITTKSFEQKHYERHKARKIIYCTQTFDPKHHYPIHSFEEKSGIAFIGRYEKAREKIIEGLLEEKVLIKLAGQNWNSFARRHKNAPNLQYYGGGLFGEDYRRLISSSKIGLGLISKWIPEKHTTRTFEIPACGTALATEKNIETCSYFNQGEAIFFKDKNDLIAKTLSLIEDNQQLKEISINGYKKVTEMGYDNRSIIERIVTETGIQECKR